MVSPKRQQPESTTPAFLIVTLNHEWFSKKYLHAPSWDGVVINLKLGTYI